MLAMHICNGRIVQVTSNSLIPDYALHSLGWNAFQHLCGTILREVWGQTFQVFADGNDAGRDGAFYGVWESEKGDIYSGHTTVQCKFTNRIEKSILPNELNTELEKARKLAKSGLADNYVLITNCNITGDTAAEIKRRFEDTLLRKNHIPYLRYEINVLNVLYFSRDFVDTPESADAALLL